MIKKWFCQSAIGVIYRRILKPIFFRRDPEDVHDTMMRAGGVLGKHKIIRAVIKKLFAYENPRLTQTLCGVEFKNPVGLAGGFDKNAQLTDILPFIGFGFVEIGSITGEPCAGNPRPRLWRLPKSKSIMVYYGLKNDGCEAIAARLRGKNFSVPVFASIAKTNSPSTVDCEAGIADYVKAFQAMEPIAQGITVNISCPNAFGGEPFSNPERLEKLLTALDASPTTKPVFLKMPADLTAEQVDALLDVILRHRVQGFIFSNLTKDRTNPDIKDADVPAVGGMSGKLVESRSNALIEQVYKRTRGSHVIVGLGGIFSAEDAYKKIRLGASLVQLITGMIFEGPQLIGEINGGLIQLLDRDGFASIKDAVGVDVK